MPPEAFGAGADAGRVDTNKRLCRAAGGSRRGLWRVLRTGGRNQSWLGSHALAGAPSRRGVDGGLVIR